jgi:hypothetical protein
MNLEEMLNLRFVEYDGIQFQKLFYEIMRVKYGTDFEMPWAYGNAGDYKCDGYHKTEQAFYACYAPENPTMDTDASSMIKKLTDDICGLKKNIKEGKWGYSISKFVFVVNMKIKKACPAPLLSKMSEIESDLQKEFSKKIDVSTMTQYDLKIIFNTLEKEKQEFILKKAYVHDSDFEFDGAIVSKIIEHFSSVDTIKVGIHDIMEFHKKIEFNNISKERGDALEHASYSIAALEIYFEELGSSSGEILQSTVLSLYDKAKTEYPENQDLQFDFIKNSLYTISDSDSSEFKKKVSDSVLIIMSKFFENCSIFESEGIKNESFV